MEAEKAATYEIAQRSLNYTATRIEWRGKDFVKQLITEKFKRDLKRRPITTWGHKVKQSMEKFRPIISN